MFVKAHTTMALSPSTQRREMSALLRLRLREHQAEVARLREEFGDPQLALFAFTRDRLDRKSLLEVAHRDGNSPAAEADADDFLDAW
jgi:hypothetical protein